MFTTGTFQSQAKLNTDDVRKYQKSFQDGLKIYCFSQSRKCQAADDEVSTRVATLIQNTQMYGGFKDKYDPVSFASFAGENINFIDDNPFPPYSKPSKIECVFNKRGILSLQLALSDGLTETFMNRHGVNRAHHIDIRGNGNYGEPAEGWTYSETWTIPKDDHINRVEVTLLNAQSFALFESDNDLVKVKFYTRNSNSKTFGNGTGKSYVI